MKNDEDAITGLDVFGTQFNDNILADSGSFKGRLLGMISSFLVERKLLRRAMITSMAVLVTTFLFLKECRRATM